MKKLFLTLAVALSALCASAKGNKIPVYAWSGYADKATENRLLPTSRLGRSMALPVCASTLEWIWRRSAQRLKQPRR